MNIIAMHQGVANIGFLVKYEIQYHDYAITWQILTLNND